MQKYRAQLDPLELLSVQGGTTIRQDQALRDQPVCVSRDSIEERLQRQEMARYLLSPTEDTTRPQPVLVEQAKEGRCP